MALVYKHLHVYIVFLEQCANFLSDLFERGLSYCTFSDYRSMFSAVLLPINREMAKVVDLPFTVICELLVGRPMLRLYISLVQVQWGVRWVLVLDIIYTRGLLFLKKKIRAFCGF